MEFKATITTPGTATLTETTHASISDAVKAISASVESHPEILKGFDDLALITDTADETVVVALFRMGEEFILARETTDARYAEELESMESERYDSDGDPYMVFARWDVVA
jgi:hypothetical protein